jgi:hypothetical protein
MKRTGLLALILMGALVVPTNALGAGAGHNAPTKKLEASFTIALNYRIKSKNGCYPPARKLPAAIMRWSKARAAVAPGGLRTARVPGVVYVLKQGTSCNGVRFALRYKRVVYVLDSLRGEIKIIGRRKTGKDPSRVANRGPLRGVRLVSKGFHLDRIDKRKRLDVSCPGRTVPLGGGIVNTPGVAADGEGVYANSFERLGAQAGWHVTAWLFDPTGPPGGRNVALQVVCGLGLAPMSSPHRTVFIKPGQVKSVVATCPKGQQLMSGGFQRTDTLSWGGNYVTESRAISSRAWRVSGSAHGKFGGELTAIAYCVRAGGAPLLTEVASPSVPVPPATAATATTPSCPAGQVLTTGGFSAGGSRNMLFADGAINNDDSWSATGYGNFGDTPSMTAFGYCLQLGR